MKVSSEFRDPTSITTGKEPPYQFYSTLDWTRWRIGKPQPPNLLTNLKGTLGLDGIMWYSIYLSIYLSGPPPTAEEAHTVRIPHPRYHTPTTCQLSTSPSQNHDI
jgi:hypothetical protein